MNNSKKIVIQSVILICLTLLLDFIYFKLELNTRLRYQILYFISLSCILFLFSINIIYTFQWVKRKRFLIIISTSVFLLSMFIASRFIAIDQHFSYVMSITKHTKNIWEKDYFLSHKGKSYVKGFSEYKIGDSIHGKIPVLLDSLGFRHSDYKLSESKDINLFLGCSFTFGSFITAEETYSHVLSKKLNANYLNAGIPSYGLGQMYQLIDTLISKTQFKYVFIQVSPWLVERAMQKSFINEKGYHSKIYFSKNEDRSFSLNFDKTGLKTKVKNSIDWSSEENTYKNRFRFLIYNGLKTHFYIYLHAKFNDLKSFLGMTPPPTKDKEGLELYVYKHIIETIIKHGSIPVLVKMGYHKNLNCSILEKFRNSVLTVDTDIILDSIAEAKQQSHPELFNIHHVHKGVKIHYDTHHNAFANKLMANEVYKVLNR